MSNEELAYKMIPVLIHWAKTSWNIPHYYSDLSNLVGYNSNHIGGVLGIIHNVLKDLSSKNVTEIPTLNSLVQNKSTGLPSDGFDFVIPQYSNLSNESKKGEVLKLNEKAHDYNWDWVLNALGLEEFAIFEDKQINALENKIQHGFGGESDRHRSMKEFIYKNPESVGIKNVLNKDCEKKLLSGDSLDVFFECKNNKRIAIEVKPYFSPEGDVLRGLYQCVKYKAVMDAERVFYNKSFKNEVMLVIGGIMSDNNKLVALDLGINYIDNFNKHHN